ncbi:unnamed protein product [Camellia sinensis]
MPKISNLDNQSCQIKFVIQTQLNVGLLRERKMNDQLVSLAWSHAIRVRNSLSEDMRFKLKKIEPGEEQKEHMFLIWRWSFGLKKMDVNESNSHSHESKHSRGSENGKEDKKSTEKDIHDPVFINHGLSHEINGSNSHSHEIKPSRDSKNRNEGKKSTEKDSHDLVFINHAELAWHQSRKAWIGDRSRESQRVPREPIMSWNTSYEDLLLSSEPFQQPIALAEMVDFLVDIWHEEGLYD